jgi:hypothetical protein
MEHDIPMQENDHPELDESPILDDQRATLYGGIVCWLNWMVTLGQFDIMYATNTLARFSMNPRHGQLIRAFWILSYLQKYPNRRLLINPNHFNHSILGAPSKHFDTRSA